MSVRIKSDYGGKVRDFYKQSDGTYKARDGTPLPPIEPSYCVEQRNARSRAGQFAWIFFRACLWTILICSGAGLAIYWFPTIWGLLMANPIGTLAILFAVSLALLLWTHHE